MNRTQTAFLIAAAALLATADPASAFRDREDNVGTVANWLSGCEDVYTFQAAFGQQVAADIDHDSLGAAQDFVLRLIGPDGGEVCSNNNDENGSDPSIVCTIEQAGLHRLQVELLSGACVSTSGDPASYYLLHVSLRSRASEGPVSTALAASSNKVK